MTSAFDDRLVKVSFDFGDKLRTYGNDNPDLAITASGCLFANPKEDECEIKISNLSKEVRDFLCSQTSPYVNPAVRKQITLSVGRMSYGTVDLYTGDIISATPSQPPDITLTIKAKTGNFLKTKLVKRAHGKAATLSAISKGVASDISASLKFQATDKNVGNYSFNGGSLKQLNKLGEAGTVDVFLHGNTLVVKDRAVPLLNSLRILSKDSGMIGIPEPTEFGVKVKFLLDNQTHIGGALQLKSQINPALNGNYAIYKLAFEVASRDTPFYYVAEAIRLK